MKITFDDRALMIQVLSIKNPYLVFEEGTEKNEIVFWFSDSVNDMIEAVGVGVAPFIIPQNVEFDSELRLLIWNQGDNDYKTFTVRFQPKN